MIIFTILLHSSDIVFVYNKYIDVGTEQLKKCLLQSPTYRSILTKFLISKVHLDCFTFKSIKIKLFSKKIDFQRKR